jgi:hypothetical protein
MRGWVCTFKLLLGITSAVFLGLSASGLMSFIFLPFIERRRERERERENRKLGVVVV